MSDVENVIVIGSGPAGYTAALYTSRANLNPLVIEGFAWGGLLQQTTDVENYPGFPEGIMGPEMMQKLRDQAERFGARLLTEEAERVALASAPGGLSRTARQAVGYRELLRHIEEGADLEACVDDAIIQSRRLARRQRSWFLRDPRIEWFDDADEARARLLAVLNGPDGYVRD